MALITMIIAHIYIGSVGMEGAIDAMKLVTSIVIGQKSIIICGLRKKIKTLSLNRLSNLWINDP